MKFLLLSVLAVAMIGVMVPSAFASHNADSPPPYIIEDEFRYYIIFVAFERNCIDIDTDINVFFRNVGGQYFHKYGFDFVTSKIECISASGDLVEGDDPKQYGLQELTKAVERAEVWDKDLVVIVFDGYASNIYQDVFQAGGHYYWKNYEHIVSTSFNVNSQGESEWNALVMSEELSHFILRYLGYPNHIWASNGINGEIDQSYVHSIRNQYYYCKNNDFQFDYCPNTYTTIKSYSGNYHVLPPYDKPIPETSYSNPREQYALDYQSKRWDYYNELKNKINSYSYNYDYQSSAAQNYIQKANEKYQSSNQLLNTIYQNLRNADQLLANGSIESAITQYSNSGTELMAANSDINLLFNYRDLAKSAENQFQSQNIPTCSRIGAEGDYSYDKGVLAYYQEKYDKNKQQLSKIAISGERNDAYFTALNANQNLGNLLDEIKSSLEKVKIFLSNEDFCEASERLDDIEDYKFTKLDQHNSIVENYLEDDSTENLTFGQSDSRSGKEIAWEKLNYVYDNFIAKRADNSAYPLSERMTELNSKGFANNFKSEHEEMRQIYQELNRIHNFDIPELYDLGHDYYKNQDYVGASHYLENAERLIIQYENKKNELSLMIQDAENDIMNRMNSVENDKEIQVLETEVVESKQEQSPQPIQETTNEGGGCLIATAAFGSEMAPQVQFLRELRDNTVLQTTSGTTFMNTFNQFYYSFSPQIADYERENPVFKEAVKVTLTPLLTSLTLLNYVEIDSEEEMLGYGIGIILLNIGMYFVLPATVILQVSKCRKIDIK